MAIKSVHYDLTDLCNAGCPQCPRTNVDGCRPQSWLARGVTTAASFRRHSPPEFLQSLDSAFFCGNYGDAIVVPELIDILQYCWESNPKLRLQVHTNASARTSNWWQELAKAASGHCFRVIAGIDGASHETNRRYRVRTDFARIMANLAAFIGAGGQAEWQMIVFKHNEHEIAAAEQMAKDRGFAAFRSFPSNRFHGKESHRYTYAGETFSLEPPTGSYAPKSPQRHTIATVDVVKTQAVIDCEAMRKSAAFIDFEGYLLPCCYIGGKLYRHLHGTAEQKDRAIGEIFDAFDMRRVNAETVGFAAARRAHDEVLAYLEPYWAAQQPLICKSVCGKKIPVAGN